MSNGGNFVRDVRDGLLDSARTVVNNHDDESYADGFAEATKICTAVLSKNIADLMAKMKSAPYLTDQEQFLLASLTEIESGTEKDLREFWDGTATDEGLV